jgi:hypothetical protein
MLAALPPSRIPRLYFAVSALLVVVTLAPLRAAENNGLITRDEVLRSLETQASAWQTKIRDTRPRLYFSDQNWPQVVTQLNALPASRAHLRDAFVTAMDNIVAESLPVYLPPEQMAGKRGDAKTLYSAMEELWQREVGNQIFALAIAAKLYPERPYRAKLHDLVMAAIGFETWGRNTSKMGNNADLAAGHIGRGLAVAYDWHRNIFTDAERQQIRTVVAERMPCLLKGLYGDAFWARGFEENHNQVSVAALGFCGIAFYDELPGAPEWLAAARLNFLRVADHASADGSSVEGVSYWTYGMNYILQYIEATRPIIDSADLYQRPFLRNAAAYRLNASTSGLTGNLPWGDAVTRDWSTPHAITYRLAAEYGDTNAAWFADHLPSPRGGADDRVLNLLWARTAPASGAGPISLDHRQTTNDLVTSRSGWESSDYLLSFKGGFTNRNHSHLDAGALAIAFGDEWVMIAPGYGHGSGEGAFWQSGSTRWNYFSNATESHSTLLVNGKNQRFDRNARGTVTGFFSAPQWNWTTMDLSKAYNDVQTISRSVLHRRGDYILVFDAVTAAQPVTVEWLSQFRYAPKPQDGGGLLVKGKNGLVRINTISPAATLTPRDPSSPKVDVKKEAHFTYATKETGPSVAFTTLVQAVPATQTTPPLQTRVANGQLDISGAGWTDHVIKSDTPQSRSLTLPGLNNTAETTARLAVIRTTTDGGVASVLALETTALNFTGFSYQSETPCDLAVEKTADGWNVTASRDVQKNIKTFANSTIRFALAAPDSK